MLKLGTDRHHDQLLAGIDSLFDIGCFGLTELGYGNNAVEMETTAVYDKETGDDKFCVDAIHILPIVLLELNTTILFLFFEHVWLCSE